MSYLVYCTFDLKNASSRDYEKAYEDLNAIGLAKVVKADAGHNVVIPTTSTMGFFNRIGSRCSPRFGSQLCSKGLRQPGVHFRNLHCRGRELGLGWGHYLTVHGPTDGALPKQV